MKWQGRRQSSNVSDRRGSGGVRRGASVGGAGLVLMLLISLIFGGPEAALETLGKVTQQGQQQTEYIESPEDEARAEFVSVVLADTEDVWNGIFSDYGYDYEEPTLVMYHDYVTSACGGASSEVGPFYCPADKTVYIDLDFFEELETKFGASGDFAMAYVISHEVGHHVQNLLGVMDQMQEIRAKVSQTEYNKYSVRLELQADYLAGVWAKGVADKGYLEIGDIDEAINAAEAVGDDAIQKAARGYVVPDSFTHGTSEQRSYWFAKGFETGNLDSWDTFNTNEGF
jgi:predicted metalloprotease